MILSPTRLIENVSDCLVMKNTIRLQLSLALIVIFLVSDSMEAKAMKGLGPKGKTTKPVKQGMNINDNDISEDFEGNSSISEENELRNLLLRSYLPQVRPVVNASSVTRVGIGLTVIQIVDIDEQKQIMVTNVQVSLEWFDEHLTWEPDEYNSQKKISMTSREIWTPDIVLFNSADVAYSAQRDNYLINVQHTGMVSWIFPDVLRSYCAVDITHFPFDTQSCELELQSWARTVLEIDVYDLSNNTFSRPFIETEWKLMNITVRRLSSNDFRWLQFTFSLKRNYAFYVNHMIFPFAILSCLTLFVFWLPPDSGEKITLTITILLALTVFLQLVSDYTPKASSNLPVIGKYFNVNLIMVLISVILTIMVLNCHHRGPKKRAVPHWAKVLIIDWIGCIVCIHHSRSCKPTRRRPVSSNHVHESHSSGDIESHPLESRCSPSSSDDLLSRGLDDMLQKLQSTFDPSRVRDDDLKTRLLLEILQCQKLLITRRARKGQVEILELDRIYDEWRTLAMVIDRVCFFVYLVSLVASSLVLLLKEVHISEGITR